MLTGRRVLDLCRQPGGMFCTKLFRWLGAEVTVVAPPGDDRLISWQPVAIREGSEPTSIRYLHYNHGKKRIEVDVRSEAGRQWLLEEVGNVDVIVEDWGGNGAFERATNLTYRELRQRNPQLVFCRISPFGQSGPYASFAASDLTIQASSGLLYLTGDAGLAPLRANEDVSWNLAGLHAAIGAALALVKAMRSGVGGEVDVSAQAAVAVTLEAPYGRVVTGAPTSRMGSRHYATSPCNIYEAQDGWVGVCANQDVQIAGIVEAVGRGEFKESIPLVDDLRQNAELSQWFDSVLESLIKKRRVSELVAESRQRGLLLAKVNEMADLCADPHVRARGGIRPLGEGYPEQWRDVAAPFRYRSAEQAARKVSDWHQLRPDSRPLEGLTVVDFSSVWAGPYCTKFLAAAGAEVIKIENPQKPDVFRRYPPFLGTGAENECSSFFADQNCNKKSILLDVKEPGSAEVIRSLLRTADVLVENFRPHVMASWGLGFEDVLKINPKIVYASISGYGHSGPYSARPAYGALMESEAGLASLIGYSTSRPYRSGTSLPDPILGAMAAVAVSAGLARSLTTGVGMHVDVTMLEATMALLGPAVLAWTALGTARQRRGNLSWEGVPEGCYRCSGPDEWVALSVRDDNEWQSLCAAIDDPQLARDQAYGASQGRLAHAQEIDRRIEGWSLKRTKWHAAERLRRGGVPAFAVLTLQDVIADPQLIGFGFFPTIRHPEMGEAKVLGIPFRMCGASWPMVSPPPLVGQHTAEIRARSGASVRR